VRPAPHADFSSAPEHSGPVRWVPIESPGFYGPYYRWVGPCAVVKVKQVHTSARIRDVDKALGGIVPGATKCYMFALERGFEGEGLLSLDLRLLPDGGVDMTKVINGLWPALDGCIRSVASRSHFQPLGDGGATVNVLLDLSLRDAGAEPCKF
jgi:hypothetical protein